MGLGLFHSVCSKRHFPCIHFDHVSDITECPENASGAPVCVCDAGFDGNLTFDEDDGWSGTCVVIEEEPEPAPVLPDCDVTIGMDDANYAFDPVSVEIDFGQTVCWQWTNSTEPHNVAQVAESSDTTKKAVVSTVELPMLAETSV